MPSLDEMRRAARFVEQETIVRTPLIPLQSFKRDSQIWLKPETLQPIGSYKLRGVLYWANQLDDDERQLGLSTHSAGNTAQALGVAAAHFQVSAKSLLPDRTPANKIELIRRYGVEPHTMSMDALLEYVFSGCWQQEPICYLNPWANDDMVAGNATIGLEIIDDLPSVRTVYVPVGGGGLMAGVGSALTQLVPDLRIVAVQPEACPALAASLAAGKPTWVESRPTICDTSLPLIVDELYPLLERVVDDVILVSDEEVIAAMQELFRGNHLVTEAAGAMSFAAARKDNPSGDAVCILSGASIGADEFVELMRRV